MKRWVTKAFATLKHGSGEDADIRARLLMGFLAGMAITRDLNSKFDLSHERAVVMREQLRSAVAAFLMPAT